MGRMNQDFADKLFEGLDYLTSLMEWNDDMSTACGGSSCKETEGVQGNMRVLSEYLYENEISDKCKLRFDGQNKSMYHHYNKELVDS